MDPTHPSWDKRLSIIVKAKVDPARRHRYIQSKKYNWQRPALVSSPTIGEWFLILCHIAQNPYEEKFSLSLPSARYEIEIRESNDDELFALPEPLPVIVKIKKVWRKNPVRPPKIKKSSKLHSRPDIMQHCKCTKMSFNPECPLHEKNNITVGFPDGSIRSNR